MKSDAITTWIWLLLWSGLLCPAWILAQEKENPQPAEAGAANTAASDQEKALRYHEALQRRPTPGYLFDRFHDAWLETSTSSELEEFLTNRVTQSSATNDRLLLAFFFAKQGDDVRAVEQFRIALANDPSSAATYFEKAVIEARTLDFETALTDLAKAAESAPNKELAIRIAQLQGSLHVRNRNNDEAVRTWNKLVADNPQDEALMEDLIELQMTEGLFAEAEALSEKLIQITKDPYQQVMRQLRKGDVLQRAGKQKLALGVYGETLQKVGLDTWLEREVMAQIEELFRREDNLSGLKDHLTAMVALEPNRMAIRKTSAKLLLELGMADEAIKAFTEIVELTPGDRANREALIGVLAESGRLDIAIRQSQTLAELYPADAELQITLAELHQKNNKSDDAVTAIAEYLKRSGDSEYAFLRAARILDRFGQPERAQETFEKCIATHPDSETARESFAAYLYEHENKARAIEIWKALAQGGDRSQIVRVARILTSRQEHSEAFALLLERFDDLQNDGIFLGQLADEAIALAKFEQAIPWVRQRVKLAGSAGDLEAAIGQAVRVFEKAPSPETLLNEIRSDAVQSIPITCLLAEMLEIQGDRGGADKVLESAIAAIDANAARDEADASAQLQMLAGQRVRLFMARQDWAAAAAATRSMIEMPGGRKSVNVRRLVELYLRDGQLDSALTWIQEWKQVSPGSLLPWINESQALSRMGRTEESLRVLRLATQKFPADADLAAMLAQRFIENGQPHDAERIYWKQYEESEQLSDKLRWTEQLAQLSEELGNTDELVRSLEDRRRNNPQSIEPLLAIAQAHRIAENYEERRKALLEATRLQPDSLPLLMEIARLEQTEGDWEKAIATLEQAKKLDPSGLASQQIAKIYLEYGEPEKGLAILVELAGGENADPRDIEVIADTIVGMGDWEQARDFLLPHAIRLPDDYRLQYLLAIIREELNETELAIDAFVELLSVEGKLPGVNAASLTSNPLNSQMQMIEQVFPPAAAEIVRLVFHQGNAYSYREDNGGMSFMAFSTGQNFNVELPMDDRECRAYATCHLATLSGELAEDQRQAIVRTMENSGVGDAALLAAMIVSPNGLYQNNAALAEEFPGNQSMLAISVMNAMNDEVDPKLLDEAYQAFKEDYRELAFFAAIGSAVSDEANLAILSEAIDSVSKLDQPSEMVVSGIARLQMGNEGVNSKLPPEQLARLNKLLIDWYPAIRNKNTSGMGNYLFPMIARSIQTDPAPDRLISFLDEEVAQFAKSSKNQNSSQFPYGMYSRSGEEGLVRMMPFPPTKLANFPEHVLRTLNPARSGYDDPFGGETPGVDTDWIEKFGGSIANAKSPMLRAMLELNVAMFKSMEGDAQADDHFQAIKQSLETMLKADPPELDAFLLAASLATREQRWNDVVDLLERSRNLPMNKELRQTIDGALVATATAGLVVGLDQPQNSPVVSSARSAALRLRRNRLDAEQRAELLQAFETLGLNEEAEKLESNIAQNLPSGVPFAMPSFPSGNTSPDRITELLDSGKNEAAVRLLAQQFNGMARAEFSIDSMFQNNHEWTQFAAMVKSLDVQDELLTQLDPGESGSSSKLTNYGLALEYFGDRAKAVSVYEKALEENAKQLPIRVRLSGLQLESDASRLVYHLGQVPEKELGKFGTALISMLGQDEVNFESTYTGLEKIVEFVEGLSDAETADLDWLQSALEFVTSPNEMDDALLLDSIYAIRKGDADPAKTPSEMSEKEKERAAANQEKIAAATARRDVLHDRLCRAMMKVPTLMSSAFASWNAALEARGATPGVESLELARNAILKSKKSKTAGPNFSGMQRAYAMQRMSGYYEDYGDDPEGFVKIRSPLEFVARHYGLSTDSPAAEELNEFLDALRAEKRVDEADSLAALQSLYRAPDAEFIRAATEYMEKASRRDPAELDSLLENVVGIWHDRSLPIDLGKFLIEAFSKSKDVANYMEGQSSTAIASYLAGLAKQQRMADVRKFLDDYSLELLGPRDAQKELVEKVSQGTRRGNVRMNDVTRVRQYEQLLSRIASKRELLLVAMDEASRLNVSNFHYTATQSLNQIFQSAKNADELLAWLEASPLLKPIDEFQPYRNGESGETIWGAALTNRVSLDFPAKDEVVQRLSAKQPISFGEGVFLLALKESVSEQSVYELLGKELATFESLEPDRRSMVASFISDILQRGMRPAGAKLSAEALQARAAVMNVRGASANETIQGLMNAKKLSDLGLESHELDEWVSTNLAPIAQTDREKFLPAVHKILTLLDKNASSSSRGGYESQMSASLLDTLLREIIREGAELNSISVVLDLMAENDLPQSTPGRGLEYLLSQRLKNEFETLRGAQPDSPIDSSLEALIQILGSAISDRDTSFLIPTYTEVLKGLETPDLELALDRMKHGAAQGNYPQLSADWAAAIQFAQLGIKKAKEPAETIARLEAPNEVQARLLAILNDAGRSLNWRLPIAAFLLAEDPSLPADGIWASIGVIGEAMKSDTLRGSDNYVVLALDRASELKDSPSFGPKAEIFAAAWKKSLLSSSSPYGVSTTHILSAIRFFHILDQPAVISQLISKVGSSAANRAVAARLIEIGMSSQAATLCKTLWNDPDSLDDRGESAFYTIKLHEGLPEFLKLMNNDGTRLLAEATFASLPDPKDEKEKTAIALAERLNQLAARYPGVSFSSKLHNQFALVLLSQADNATEFIATPLAELASKIRSIGLWDDRSGGNSGYALNQKLVSAHVSLSLRSGNLQPLNDLTKRLIPDPPPDDNWSYRQAVANIRNELAATMLKSIGTTPKETIRQMLPDLRKLGISGMHYENNSSEYYTLLLVAHAVADESVAFGEWARSNPAGDDSRPMGDLDDVWPVIAKQIAKDDIDRIQKISAIWKMANETGIGVGTGHFQEGIKEVCATCSKAEMGLDAIRKAGLISTEEIASVGPTLAEINSVNGEIWRQVGHEQLAQKQFAEAAESFHKAILGAKEEMRQAKTNRLVEYAYALQQCGKTDEAQIQLKDLDAGQLLGDNVKRFRVLTSKSGE